MSHLPPAPTHDMTDSCPNGVRAEGWVSVSYDSNRKDTNTAAKQVLCQKNQFRITRRVYSRNVDGLTSRNVALSTQRSRR